MIDNQTMFDCYVAAMNGAATWAQTDDEKCAARELVSVLASFADDISPAGTALQAVADHQQFRREFPDLFLTS